MNGFNRVLILGNVGKRPETKQTKSGLIVTSFSIATTRQWKDKHSGETRRETTWIPCAAFGRTAEIIERYVGKGSALYVEGHWQNDQYEKNGEKRTYTKCMVDSVQLLPSGREGDGKDGRDGGGSQNTHERQTPDFEGDFPLDIDELNTAFRDAPDVDTPF
jgi:single-strand DNA-binding protein